MKQFIAFFSKPIILPGDQMEKIRVYGLLFEDTEMATINRITNYIHNYIWAVSELFRDGVEHISENTYKKDGKVFRVNDENWCKYVNKAEKKKNQFAFIGEGCIDIKEEDFYDGILLTNKDKWKEFKGMPKLIWL